MTVTAQGIFTIYDLGCQCQSTDTSTPALARAVSLENMIRNDNQETGAFIASDGSVVIQKTGLPNQVSFKGAELNGTDKTVFTHNHPENNSFSLPDVIAAIESNLIEVRAVGPTIRHRMWAPNGWPGRHALMSALNNAVPRAQRTVAHMVASGALDGRHAQLEISHQLWVLVGKALGLEYKRERS